VDVSVDSMQRKASWKSWVTSIRKSNPQFVVWLIGVQTRKRNEERHRCKHPAVFLFSDAMWQVLVQSHSLIHLYIGHCIRWRDLCHILPVHRNHDKPGWQVQSNNSPRSHRQKGKKMFETDIHQPYSSPGRNSKVSTQIRTRNPRIRSRIVVLTSTNYHWYSRTLTPGHTL